MHEDFEIKTEVGAKEREKQKEWEIAVGLWFSCLRSGCLALTSHVYAKAIRLCMWTDEPCHHCQHTLTFSLSLFALPHPTLNFCHDSL